MLRLFFMVLLLLVFFMLGALDNLFALGPQYEPAVRRQYQFLADKHPRYPSSLKEAILPEEALDKGTDCSMLEFLTHKWAGVPGIQRVTAERMSQGLGGWIGYDVLSFGDLKPFDILFFHMGSQPGKYVDHTGSKFSETEFIHSGVSANGPAIIPISKPWIRKYFVKGRHLTIGE